MASDLASSTDQLPRVAIIMGSRSDWPTMQHSAKMLDALQVGHKALVVSAHDLTGFILSRKAPKMKGSA